MQHRPSLLALALATAFPLTALAQDVELQAIALTPGEVAYNQAHVQVRANLAHAAGYTGRNAIVAVLDTGLDGKHIELNTRLANSRMFDATTRKWVAPTDGDGHGTHVGGIIAGSTGTGYSYGIAPDAKLLGVKVFSSDGTASSTALANGLKTAAGTRGVSIINMSLGGTGPLGTTFESALRSAITSDKLIVAAAGNHGGASPIWPARYAKETWANGQIIAVGAVDANNQIASFSNRAGDTANWFIVAPGVNVLSAYPGNQYAYMSGTSMATPIVSGAAALLEGAWPQLTARQVASILFDTATDLGDAGTDAIYGRGLLNVERAMQPVGTLAIPTSTITTSKKKLSRRSATLRTSVASWSGLRAASSAGQFMGISVDDYNRDFKTDFGSGIRKPASESISDALDTAGRTLQMTEQVRPDGSRFVAAVEEFERDGSRLANDKVRSLVASSAMFSLAGGQELAFATGSLAGRYFGLADTDAKFANPYLGLARSSAQLAFGYREGSLSFKAGVLDAGLNAALARQHTWAQADGGRAAVGELNYALGSRAMVGVQFANVAEQDTWLGSLSGDAFALDRSETRTLTAHTSYRIDRDMLFAAQYSAGRTVSAQGSGLMRAVEGVRSEAFSLGIIGHNTIAPDDRFTVSLSSPLRVTRGTAELSMPVGVAPSGEALFESRRVDLAATSRELKLGLDYVAPLSKTSSLSWLLSLRHNANHVSGERETQTGLIYRASF